ncbi:MAG: MerR family transcriptional regulator [Cellulosilyticum sp.]|nr:MerR family transcriptional regulator [Cellulosilyticum sp.]
MLRIGEFSKVTGVSIHMLRNYDKTGLLVPTQVDRQTGYRYYDESQIIQANQIQVLKRLGFGLKEIMSIQQEDGSEETVQDFLKNKIQEKIKEREAIEDQIKQMTKALIDLEEKELTFALEMNIKTFPARIVASLRDTLHAFPEEGRLWTKLANVCRKQSIRLADVDYSFAITHYLDLEHMVMEVEVQRVVDRIYKEVEDVRFFKVPECQVVTVAFKGQYTQIGELNLYIDKWIRENNYKRIGLPFTTYYRSPGNEQNPEQFITELCFPIKRKK